MAEKFKVNDKVKRAGLPGVYGIVKDVRKETTAKGESKEKNIMICVQWDNGTQSYFSPEALEIA